MLQDVSYPLGTVEEVRDDVVEVFVAGKPNFNLSRLSAPASGSSQPQEPGFLWGHELVRPNGHHPGSVEAGAPGWQGSSMIVCFGSFLTEAGKSMGDES